MIYYLLYILNNKFNSQENNISENNVYDSIISIYNNNKNINTTLYNKRI